MKKVFVFCIGGTGIRVMKSIIMLMAGGMDTNGYEVVPILIDPHHDLEERKNLGPLVDSYRKIYGYMNTTDNKEELPPLSGFCGSKINTVENLNGESNDTQESGGTKEKFGSYIKVANLANDDPNNYLVETLFSTKNLNNSLAVGFKGNPNVGTVVLGEILEGQSAFRSFKQLCEKDDRVFIISSIFGGTGASGFPLLEKKIKMANNEPAVKNAVMGAVTVLPYYKLKDPTINDSDIDSSSFYTKTKAALAYYNGTVQSDFLYYVGEKRLDQVYENDEKKQNDTANFIEVVAASALFDFLKREEPKHQQFLSRAIDEDTSPLDIDSMGEGYKDIVKSVADFMLLSLLVRKLPDETDFPLKINRGFTENFYTDTPMRVLNEFCDRYEQWYKELSQNTRAFAPLRIQNTNNMSGWIEKVNLEAENDSYYLLEMIKASNRDKERHSNKFRFFLKAAYSAINTYTKKIYN